MEAIEPRDPKQMHLTAHDAKILMIMYSVLLISSIAYVGCGIVEYSVSPPPIGSSVLYCSAMAVMGSCIYYVRKLYKALINDTFTFLENIDSPLPHIQALKRLGTICYFIFRPLFGIAFSFMIYSLWRLSLAASGSQEVTATLGLLYTSIALGFASGFLAGRLLTMFEGYGTRQLGGLLGHEA